jgi:hypothetical protein
MADELREKIADLLGKQFGQSTIIDRQAYKAADAILELPEIKEALEKSQSRGLQDIPPYETDRP